MMEYYYDEIEHELYAYDSHDDDAGAGAGAGGGCDNLSPEDWQDLHSQELLNLWMSIVEYHEDWYLPLRKTFNQFCEFVYRGDVTFDPTSPPPEIQAIKDHPWIKDLDWEEFFI